MEPSSTPTGEAFLADTGPSSLPEGEAFLAEAEIYRWCQENLGRLLLRVLETFERDVLDGFRARGIEGLERADLPVLRNVRLEGSRVTEIAERAGLTKQTISPLVRGLAEQGILRLDPDPTDGRAKVVRFTDRGLRGLITAAEVIRETVERYTEHLGEARMEELRASLLALLERFERRPQESDHA